MAGPSTVRAPRPLGTHLAELLWLRSMTAPAHAYLVSADGERRVTYGELRRATVRWSVLLDDLTVPPGATVGIALSAPLDFAVVFLGVLAAGRVAAPLDPGATDAELVGVCGRVEPSIVVGDRPAPDGLGRGDWVTMPAGSFELHQEDLGPPWRPETTGAGAVGGLVLSTSGTTGRPKVVRLDEPRLLHTARAVAAGHQLTSADTGFNPLPLFHINAEVVGLLATLVSGATIVLDDRFHRRGFWETMARHGVTWINAVPAVLARLAALHRGEQVPPGIRFARSASAPLPGPFRERFEQTTGIPVVESYGMTEAASQITANPLSGVRKPGSAGVPVTAEVRVVPDAGTDRLAPGRVLVRGPGVIESYASAGYEDRFDEHGWLDTGDLGYLDEDGYLFLVGRADDVINRGGEKIHPKEVEDVVLAEPGVASAVVVGRDHESLGQVPVAYLVLDPAHGAWDRPRVESLVARVIGRCTERLSRPKRPVAFYVVERLPQGPTGKVQRRAVTGCAALYSLLVL